MAIPIRIKRRDESNADDNAPGSLLQGELSFNEHSRVLHYGRGASPAVVALGGDGHSLKLPNAGATLGFVTVNAVRSGATMHTTENRSMTGTASEVVVANGNGASGAPTFGIADDAVLPGNGALTVVTGTTGQEPGVSAGQIRYDSTTNKFRVCDNAAWADLAISGGDPDQNLWETMTADTGSIAANTTTDSFDVGGGTGVVTAISGDGVTINFDIANMTPTATVAGDMLVLGDVGASSAVIKRAASDFISDQGIALLDDPDFTSTPTAPTAAKATDTTQLATTAFVKTQDVNDLAAPGASFSMNSQKITGLLAGTADTDAVNFGQLASVASGIDWKASVQLVETVSNLDLTGEETIDGTLTSSSRVLLTAQTATEENGIYDTGAGAWSRSGDANSDAEVNAGMAVFVTEGTTNEDTGWMLTTDDPITLDTTGLAFSQFSGSGDIVAGTGLTKSGSTINAIGTASRISVSADAIDIDSSYVGQATITTLGTIGTGVWEGTAVADEFGGTGQTAYAQGDILYASAVNVLSKLTKGAEGSMLDMSATIPQWITSIDGGTF